VRQLLQGHARAFLAGDCDAATLSTCSQQPVPVRVSPAVKVGAGRGKDAIDNNHYETVTPPKDQLYVGWTEPGEWFNITIDVAKAGKYTADLLFTSNRGGSISLDVNGHDATGSVMIPTTYNDAEPIAWRQWHHWNIQRNAVTLDLPAGRNVLTVHILTGGNMNLAYFDFRPAAEE
jgi:hypothetical protein